MNDALQMSVSPICVKDNEKFAYVEFKDATRSAEGKIPMCDIVSNNGFTDDEVAQLEDYMKANLKELKSMAAKLNAFEALKKT